MGFHVESDLEFSRHCWNASPWDVHRVSIADRIGLGAIVANRNSLAHLMAAPDDQADRGTFVIEQIEPEVRFLGEWRKIDDFV
jgi:hypothetical protein